MKKQPRRVRRTAQRRTPPAPAIVHRLIQGFLLTDKATIDRAYQHARQIVLDDEPVESVSKFVEPSAEAYIQRHAPDALESDAWERHSGTIYGAISDPAFTVGFALAHLLFTDKGGAR